MLPTQTTDFPQSKRLPATAHRSRVVLGSGLGGFADELADRVEIPYAEIPGWPRSTAVGHAGKLVFGHAWRLSIWRCCPGARTCTKATRPRR